MASDPVTQAAELAQIFFDLSNAVDDFRLRNFGSLSHAQQQQLKEEAQALATRGQQFTAAALGAILARVQPHLQNIKRATQDAQDALARLNDVAKAIAIVDAAVALAGAVMTGNLDAIGDQAQGLFQAVTG